MLFNQKQKPRMIWAAFSRLKASAILPGRMHAARNLAATLILLSGVALAALGLCGSSQTTVYAQTASTTPNSEQIDAGPPSPLPTLTEQERERIWAEEIFRDEVRHQIEAEKSAQPSQNNLWSFLNSDFALWFLSSVVVAGITAAFARYQKSHSARIQQDDIQRRIQTEISSRIAEGLIAMRLEIKRIDNGQTYWASAMYSEALSYLDNQVTDGTKTLDFSSYHEYRFRKLRSLLFELTSVSEKSARTQLSAIKEGYSKLIELLDTAPMSEDYSKSPDKNAALDAVKKTIELLEGLQANSLWQTQL